jgi:phosphate acetyltransferase
VSTRSIYIASPEGETGKSTVALGVLDLLVRQVQRVGVFRAVARVPDPPSSDAGSDAPRDHVLEMLLAHDGVDVAYEDAVGVTYDDVHADPEAALSRIVDRYRAVAERCDAVVVVGTDYTDVTGATELAFNARVAANLGAPVLLVTSGRGRTPEEVLALNRLSLGELRANHAQPVGVVVNRSASDVLAARSPLAEGDLPVWTIPEEPFLHAPTVGRLTQAVEGSLMLGDPDLLAREVLAVIVGIGAHLGWPDYRTACAIAR